MTEALQTARATIKAAVEKRIVELMATTVERIKAELADAVIDSGCNPLNLVDAIVDQLVDADFSDTLRLVAVQVPAGKQ